MKTIEFKTVKFTDTENIGGDFNWKQTIKTHMSTNEWAKAYPLQTVDQIGVAIKVSALTDGKKDKVKGEDVAVHYICDCAAHLPFLPGMPLEMLVAIKEFKQYFSDLKKSESQEK
jgi:hypothetical protein